MRKCKVLNEPMHNNLVGTNKRHVTGLLRGSYIGRDGRKESYSNECNRKNTKGLRFALEMRVINLWNARNVRGVFLSIKNAQYSSSPELKIYTRFVHFFPSTEQRERKREVYKKPIVIFWTQNYSVE